MKVEYRVKEIKRYVVTRYHEDDVSKLAGVESKGEYDNYQIAYEVGYALAKAEHDRLGYPIDDMRIIYPEFKPVAAIGAEED